jgi:hypothetical protein
VSVNFGTVEAKRLVSTKAQPHFAADLIWVQLSAVEGLFQRMVTRHADRANKTAFSGNDGHDDTSQ